MKRIRNSKYWIGISQIQPLVLIITAILSLLVSYMALHSHLRSYLESRLPYYSLSITVLDEINPQAVPNREVWFEEMQIDGVSDFETLFAGSTSRGFEYRKGEDYGYSHDIIVCTGGAGSEISFAWPVGKALSCKFWKQNLSGMIRLALKVNGETVREETVDLFADKPEQYVTYTVPESTEYVPMYLPVVYIGGVALLGLLIFACLTWGMAKLICSGEDEFGGCSKS